MEAMLCREKEASAHPCSCLYLAISIIGLCLPQVPVDARAAQQRAGAAPVPGHLCAMQSNGNIHGALDPSSDVKRYAQFFVA